MDDEWLESEYSERFEELSKAIGNLFCHELHEFSLIIRANSCNSWQIGDVSLGAKSRLHFGIHWDTNGGTDFTDFTD
ncbi:MAG: hypothetical protein RLZZ628_4012 [Bacteroidota bacterium]|jgi:hypothetical protein